MLNQMITTFYFLRELYSVFKVTVLSVMTEHPNLPGTSQPLPFALLCMHVWWLRIKPRTLHMRCKLCAAGVACPALSLEAAILVIQVAGNLLHAKP